MHPRTGLSTAIEVSPTASTIDEDGIQNSVLIEQTTLAPMAKLSEHYEEYTPNELVDKRSHEADKKGGQTFSEEFADARSEFAVDCIVRDMDKRGKFDTLCDGTATHQQTIGPSHLSISRNIPSLAIGAEWRWMPQWNKNVDENHSI